MKRFFSEDEHEFYKRYFLLNYAKELFGDLSSKFNASSTEHHIIPEAILIINTT